MAESIKEFEIEWANEYEQKHVQPEVETLQLTAFQRERVRERVSWNPPRHIYPNVCHHQHTN